MSSDKFTSFYSWEMGEGRLLLRFRKNLYKYEIFRRYGQISENQRNLLGEKENSSKFRD